ncbi:dioxygenase [Flavobacterium sp. NKUCC04_CG]|uniref:dioxygenase family protein n=1 Tax=Flavobacterium sp. NKUCC04_CG TaxID=2842121 RepID=UPI001C5B3F19|nr:dioxygenase [Flavobacterium sp. NKUCC04_CG]MBW3518090.1 catechol 1,2-dioxygenase [Flavobacterium sp. NKUCC04_CG]
MTRLDQKRIDQTLELIKSQEKKGAGNERVKTIVNRLLEDLFNAMADLDITSEEMWKACDWLTQAGKNNEMGLVYAGLGIEKFIDVQMDWEDEQAGIENRTPRTIEGPLYVAGSPESNSYAELETEIEPNAERLYMSGVVYDLEGNPISGAKVEVWHCNLKGLYSHFDSSQPEFNLRRAIKVAQDGKYEFKSFVPVGYSCPPKGPTDVLMSALGRHGSRPAHIHFFVTAPGYRKLTTQINIENDPLINEDFAFATRPELIPHIQKISAQDAKKYGKNEAFAKIDFNFHMVKEIDTAAAGENNRKRASVA